MKNDWITRKERGKISIKQKKIDFFWMMLKMFIFSFIIVFIIRGFIFIPLEVVGNSMESNLMEKDYITYERFTNISRFDIIVFTLPSGETYIKRVVGLPGETIKYEGDKLYVDNKIVEEPFLERNKSEKEDNLSYTNDFNSEEIIGETKLAKDEFFVLGDNRRLSKDSRSFGAVKSNTIDGKAILIYYPLNRIKILK